MTTLVENAAVESTRPPDSVGPRMESRHTTAPEANMDVDQAPAKDSPAVVSRTPPLDLDEVPKSPPPPADGRTPPAESDEEATGPPPPAESRTPPADSDEDATVSGLAEDSRTPPAESDEDATSGRTPPAETDSEGTVQQGKRKRGQESVEGETSMTGTASAGGRQCKVTKTSPAVEQALDESQYGHGKRNVRPTEAPPVADGKKKSGRK